MAISYKKLWKLLIDRDMKKKTLWHLPVLANRRSQKWDTMIMSTRKCW